MFNLRLCNAAIIRYSQLKFGHMHLCGMDYKYFSPHCCKCNSFGCTAAIRCDNACHGPHSDILYSGSAHCQFNSPRLVKREAGFPNPRRALIGSNQLWRVNDSAYYWEYHPWHVWGHKVCETLPWFFWNKNKTKQNKNLWLYPGWKSLMATSDHNGHWLISTVVNWRILVNFPGLICYSKHYCASIEHEICIDIWTLSMRPIL